MQLPKTCGRNLLTSHGGPLQTRPNDFEHDRPEDTGISPLCLAKGASLFGSSFHIQVLALLEEGEGASG